MNKEMMLQAMNDLDEADILDAAPLTGAAKDRADRRRWMRVAVIAACLVIVLGTVAYATGALNRITFSDPKEGYEHYISDDGEEKDIRVVDSWAYVPCVRSKDIKGKVNKLKSVIRANILASRENKFVADPPNTFQNAPDFYFVNGLTQKEAVEYIGYKNLEPTWFPYEKNNTYIEVSAYLNDLSECCLRDITIRSSNIKDKEILSPDGLEGNLWITTEVTIVIDDYHDTYGTNGDQGEYGNNKYYEIISPSGVKCRVEEVSEEYFPDPHMGIGATVYKNDLVYNIRIDYSKNNQDEARRIIREWAEHF